MHETNKTITKQTVLYKKKMEPASSSDDESISDTSSIDEQSSTLKRKADNNTKIRTLDDLPSEDSCLESSSESESDSSASDSDSDSENEEGDDDQEDMNMTMEDRIHAKKNIQGVKRNPRSVAKKSQALAIAQKRLLEMKRKRTNENGNDSDSDNGSDSDSDSDSGSGNKAELKKQSKAKKSKKKSKNGPTCVSSKRKDFYSRGATANLNSSGIGVEIGANKYKPRDPRYQTLSGHFDQNVFGKRYEFLEKIQDDEIETLRQKCKAWKTSGRKGQRMRKKLGLTSGNSSMDDDQAELNRLLQERASRSDANIRTAAKRAVKKRLRDEVASGKKSAFYLKKRDMKKMELEAKFEELKRIGGDKKVNEIIAKRRKKKMVRDSSVMPSLP